MLAVRLEINNKFEFELILCAGKDFDDASGTFFKRWGLGALLVQIGKSQDSFNVLAEIDVGIEVKVFGLSIELNVERLDGKIGRASCRERV